MSIIHLFILQVPALEIDDENNVTLKKSLLHHDHDNGGKLRFRCDLVDVGCYCFSYWILDFLNKKTDISTIRTDLLPYLVARQYQDVDYINQHIPSLQHRRRGLQTLDSWLVHNRSVSESTLIPSLCYNSHINEMSMSSHLLTNHQEDNVKSISQDQYQNDDLLRCYCVLVESPKELIPYPVICQRVTNFQTYFSLNRYI